MSTPADHPRADLRQQLEILRLQGGRHRLELAMSLETLVNETGGIRRGAGIDRSGHFDVNSSKLGPTVAKRNERLVKLLNAVGDLDLGPVDAEPDQRLS